MTKALINLIGKLRFWIGLATLNGAMLLPLHWAFILTFVALAIVIG